MAVIEVFLLIELNFDASGLILRLGLIVNPAQPDFVRGKTIKGPSRVDIGLQVFFQTCRGQRMVERRASFMVTDEPRIFSDALIKIDEAVKEYFIFYECKMLFDLVFLLIAWQKL